MWDFILVVGYCILNLVFLELNIKYEMDIFGIIYVNYFLLLVLK